MANTSTAGFKREQPVFHQYVERNQDTAVSGQNITAFVLDYGAVHDTSMGAFQPTSNPLDVMIDGPGYLSVQVPGGGVAYTRAGALKILDTGDLATPAGQRILGAGGAVINVPVEQMRGMTVAADGSVIGTDGNAVGRIAVTVFDENNVSPRGDGLITATGGRELPAAETKLKSGGVEASNVQPIVETTAMVQLLRSYQTSQSMTESLNDMRMRAIQKLATSN